MRPVLRSVSGVVAGIAAGSVMIMVMQMIGRVDPMLTGLDTSNTAALASLVNLLPTGWMLGALGRGAWIAACIAQRKPVLHGAITGAVFLTLGVANRLIYAASRVDLGVGCCSVRVVELCSRTPRVRLAA